MRLLWVENHAVFTRMAGRQFLTAHDLTVVPSLAEARAVLTTEQFDIVLLDYDLDDGKGTDLLESIRLSSPRPAVIAVSSHADGNTALLEAGADAVCPKMQFSNIGLALSSAVAKSKEA